MTNDERRKTSRVGCRFSVISVQNRHLKVAGDAPTSCFFERSGDADGGHGVVADLVLAGQLRLTQGRLGAVEQRCRA